MVSTRFPCFLALFTSLLAFVAAVPKHQVAKKSSYQHYAITGIQSGVNAASGARPARTNILNMQADTITFALYIQALIAMQATVETERDSWYQVAGIHGRPYAPWDNVPHVNGAPITGYCTHSSVLFLTWHRPYLALFEQILFNHTQIIAAQYPANVRAQYVAAAANFRIPYWDWATNPDIPAIVDTPTISITTPTGVQTVANPLYQYKFQTFPLNKQYFPSSQSSAGDWYLAQDRQTVRDPDTRSSSSDLAAANGALENDNLQSRTYYALTNSPNYDNFATQAIWGPSIEGIHGSVHVDIGGEWGHMSQLSYAGFDPVFWLHHCNVDRIAALYQAMFPSSVNPNNYLTSYYEYYGTYTLVPNQANDTLSTPLEPFSTNTAGTWWTSASSQYLKTFGYTYPEIQDWNQTPAQLSQNVTAQVNVLYSGQTAPTAQRRSGIVDGNEKVLEWSAALSVSRYEISGQRFIVRLFLNGIPDDPKTWATSDKCVGSFAVLPPPQAFSGPMPDTRVHDEISLVKGLKNVGHDGQDVKTVVKYLEENLDWRIQLLDGTVVDPSQYQSLQIKVQDAVVTLPSSIYELPIYGERTVYPEITKGKGGGYSG